ncbi:Do family serine endopeptidase [Anaplasma phagocytophilum]|uniref:Do family serine endopeptidase n=1 Tax=Anaplasma phagocytophilum TaxID=948 RepID=UPI00201ADE51
MRRFLSFFFFCALVWGHCAFASEVASSALRVSENNGPSARGFSELASKLLPSVVNISTEQRVEGDELAGDSGGGSIFGFPGIPRGFFEGFFNSIEPLFVEPPKPRKVISLGSGFIIDESGLIVTNYHVIANSQEIQVKFSDGTTAKARVLGQDPKTDLAVLKVDVAKELVSVKLGNSDDALVGEWVLAIGNPFGLGGSVSVGIISGRARDINIGTASEFLQTDAAINRGHSGGPLFNADGEVIGINTAIISPQGGGNVGVAFAIPSNNAARVISILSKGEKVEHGWLGVIVQHVTEGMVVPLGLDSAHGALVANVVKGSPAEKGGLRVGDVILEYNGKRVEDMSQLTNLIAKSAVNEEVRLLVLRSGKQITLKITIGKLEEGADGAAGKNGSLETGTESLGITVGELPDGDGRKRDGVVVLRVDNRGAAFAEGIRRGDVIVGIDAVLVRNVADFTSELEKILQSTKRDSVLLLVQRGDSPPIYVAVKLKR